MDTFKINGIECEIYYNMHDGGGKCKLCPFRDDVECNRLTMNICNMFVGNFKGFREADMSIDDIMELNGSTISKEKLESIRRNPDVVTIVDIKEIMICIDRDSFLCTFLINLSNNKGVLVYTKSK